MNPDVGAIPDPFAAWRTMRDSYLNTWSRAMIDLVNSDAYAQATGAMLDSYLNASLPFQDALQKGMTQVLNGLNIPTRQEVTNLAERLTNIEVRLDDLDVRLDEVVETAAELRQLNAKLDWLLSAVDSGGRGNGAPENSRAEEPAPARRTSRGKKES